MHRVIYRRHRAYNEQAIMPARMVHHPPSAAFVGVGEGGGVMVISGVSCDIVGDDIAPVLVGTIVGNFVITVVVGFVVCLVVTCGAVVVAWTMALIRGF